MLTCKANLSSPPVARATGATRVAEADVAWGSADAAVSRLGHVSSWGRGATGGGRTAEVSLTAPSITEASPRMPFGAVYSFARGCAAPPALVP